MYFKKVGLQRPAVPIVQSIVDGLEDHDLALRMFLNMSKSYDVLDHALLLSNLDDSEVREPALIIVLFEGKKNYTIYKKRTILVCFHKKKPLI